MSPSRSFQALDQHWRETQLAALVADPRMEGFVREVRDGSRLGTSGQLPRLGLSWNDLQQVATGEVCLAVTATPEENQPGLVLLVGVEGKQPELQSLLDHLATECEHDGGQTKQLSVEGQVVRHLQMVDSQGQATHQDRFYLLLDERLVVTDKLSLVPGILHRLSMRESESLAQRPAFQFVMDSTRAAAGDRIPDGFWYVNPFGHGDLLASGSEAPVDATWQRLKTQGFDAIEAVGGIFCLARGAYDLEHFTAVYAPGPRSKTARMLAFPPLDGIQLPGWVPEVVGQVVVFGWQLDQALDGYGSWFDATYGEGEEGIFADVLQEIHDEPDGPRVDVKRELLDPLQETVTVITDAGTDQEPTAPQTLTVVATRDEAGVAQAVQRMLEGDPDVRRVDVAGHVAWQFRDAQQAVAAGERAQSGPMWGPDFSNYAICVAAGALHVASDFRLLQIMAPRSGDWCSVGRAAGICVVGPADTPADAGSRGGLVGLLPGSAATCRLRNAPCGQARSYDLLAGPVLARLLPNAFGTLGSTKASDSGYDFTQLPAFDEIKDYLHPMAGWVRQTSDGWFVEGFVLGVDAQDPM